MLTDFFIQFLISNFISLIHFELYSQVLNSNLNRFFLYLLICCNSLKDAIFFVIYHIYNVIEVVIVVRYEKQKKSWFLHC